MDAMKSSHDEIALQGIEFWSNVCDEEYELQLLQQEVKKKQTLKFFEIKYFIFRHKNKIVNQNEQVVIMLVVHYHI